MAQNDDQRANAPNHADARRRGAWFIVASAFAFSAMAVLVKLAITDLALGQLVFSRGFVTLLLSFAMVRYARVTHWGINRKRLALRGLIGFAGLSCYYATLGALPLAHATLIQNATPIVTAVLALLMLGEKLSSRVILALLLGTVGVGLVTFLRAPSDGPLDAIAVMVALAGTCFSALAYVTVRELSRTEEPLLIVLYFPLIATPLALPWALMDWRWPSAIQWLLLLGIGITTQIGQVLLTRGLACLPAGRATAIGYVQTIFAVAWGVLAFGEQLGVGLWVGMVLLASATFLVASEKR